MQPLKQSYSPSGVNNTKSKTISISNKFNRAKMMAEDTTTSVNQSNMALRRVAQNYRII